MLRGLYMAGGALIEQSLNLEVTSNNIANVNTIGFKADRTRFQPFQEVLLGRTNDNKATGHIGGLMRGSGSIQGGYVDYAQGPLTETGNPLDVGIDGPGFITVQWNENEVAYTRCGEFTLDDSNQLITGEGQMVLNEHGSPITVPPGGAVAIDRGGQILVDSVPVGRLQLMVAGDPYQLEKVGENLFRDKGEAGMASAESSSRLRQGFLERSNVSALDAITDLTVILRSFEASQKMITMMDETLKQAVADLGRTQ
ncbi:MAG: flagellar hook-basal body protein [bacterium]